MFMVMENIFWKEVEVGGENERKGWKNENV